MKYFIFSFTSCGNQIKRGVEFQYLTYNASRILQKKGNGSGLIGTESLNTRFPLPTVLFEIQRESSRVLLLKSVTLMMSPHKTQYILISIDKSRYRKVITFNYVTFAVYFIYAISIYRT